MKATLRFMIAAAVLVSAQMSFAGSIDPNLNGTVTLPCGKKVSGNLLSATNPASAVARPTATGHGTAS